MRAVIHDPSAPGRLRLGEVHEPVANADQALIEVHAAAVNAVDIRYLERLLDPGDAGGLDAAGIVLAPAANGGPPAGARVVTFGPPGAWAQRRAVDITEVALVPDSVDFGAAVAVCAAGVTALRAVRRMRRLPARRVLVTGASGGVGRLTVQLLARDGVEVIAAVGSTARGEGLRELGAADVVTALDQFDGTVDGVVDNVSGPLAEDAFTRLADPGLLLAVGSASGGTTITDWESERLRGGGRAMEVFVVGSRFAPDLAELMALLAQGVLDPQIGWRGDWSHVHDAAAALLDRTLAGKAVLDIPTDARPAPG